ncbi:MAG: hypothetical protein CVU06_13955 [Bacteroidetes bacterium HGW-Bacteroidetes-22]|nr:MAG: hypothetical protein CVU06_13955 [Bacteroidetes bacterium HGW-Bacteroidetes-22]
MKNKISTFGILFLFMLVIAKPGKCQQMNTISADSLTAVAARVLGAPSLSLRLSADSTLSSMLYNMLQTETDPGKALSLPSSIAVLSSPDLHFRIINWAVPLDLQKYTYRAFLQYNDGQQVRTISLADKSLVEGSAKAIHHGDQWYGALYYDLIEKKNKGKTTYTLLGWNRTQDGYQSKVAEVLTFDSKSGIPGFGLKIFPGYLPRYLVQYSSRANITLRYTTQSITIRKGLFGRLRTIQEKLIVHDRVTSKDIRFRNDPRFNFPTGNIYDALRWNHGQWILLRDIDARNEATPADEQPGPAELNLKPSN